MKFNLNIRLLIAKTSWITLLLLAMELRADVPVYYADKLRVIGTNLFDFSPVFSAQGAGSMFCVEGNIKSVKSDVVTIEKTTLFYKFDYNSVPQKPSMPDDTTLPQAEFNLQYEAEYDKQIALILMAQNRNKNRFSIDDYMAVGSVFKPYFKEVIETKVMTVVHWPTNFNIAPTKYVRVFCLPTNVAGRMFDYGVPYEGNLQKFSFLYQVTPNGLVFHKIPTEKEIADKKAAILAAKIRWYEQESTNGSAYCQFELGKLYLSGEGVEKDEAHGLKLIQLAADQNYEQATNYLAKQQTSSGSH